MLIENKISDDLMLRLITMMTMITMMKMVSGKRV